MPTRSRPVAQREFDDLTGSPAARSTRGTSRFYAERLKHERFDLSEEALRPYFPLPRVLAGMFTVAEKLYGVRIVERTMASTSIIRDAKFYDILNADGSRRGSFFVDLYARPKKRGGAWMDECVGRKRLGGVDVASRSLISSAISCRRSAVNHRC